MFSWGAEVYPLSFDLLFNKSNGFRTSVRVKVSAIVVATTTLSLAVAAAASGWRDFEQTTGKWLHQWMGQGMAVLVAEPFEHLGGQRHQIRAPRTERHGRRRSRQVDEHVAVEIFDQPALLAHRHEGVERARAAERAQPLRAGSR